MQLTSEHCTCIKLVAPISPEGPMIRRKAHQVMLLGKLMDARQRRPCLKVYLLQEAPGPTRLQGVI